LAKKYVGATLNKFGPKVLKLQPEAAFNSSPSSLCKICDLNFFEISPKLILHIENTKQVVN
jgi:hypothetical protein